MDRFGREPTTPDIALASDIFDHFCAAPTLKTILGYHRNLCETLNIKPTRFPDFYPKLKAKLGKSWKAQALFKKFDARAAHKCYARGEATPHTRVLIIGAGPCGLRTAIDAQLLGAKVVVVEKRDRMSRNNVLHLWPFVIQDLRALGAKKFFGKFCAGAIDHISIRQLQCILLKVALLLGVEIHEGVGFESLVHPSEGMSWRARTSPEDHPVSQYEFDVLVGADGKRNTLEGFKRKEFRGKLAIAITANFINKRSEAEAKVEEISGVAFIFNQKFFKDLYAATGIDLENIVYYKDDTHYFVMTAKKHSLINKGVIIQDFPDTAKLLALENVDRDALMGYAREAAEFSTEYQMPGMEFAVNHYGKPDVAMFDFTSMYAAETASRVLQRNGHRLLMCLVGDSLLEPFWPTGSGCARGFLSSLDACWAIRSWGSSVNPLEVVAQRESIYRLLGQTTPENLQRDCSSYTLEPSSRYPNLNKSTVLPIQVRSLFDTDDPTLLEIKATAIIPEIVEMPKKRRRRETQVHPETLLHWVNYQITPFNIQIENLAYLLESGLILSLILHRYRPDLINFPDTENTTPDENNRLAVVILEQELGIPATLYINGDQPDLVAIIVYLTQVYYTFRGEIPHIKHPKLEMPSKHSDYNTAAGFAHLVKMRGAVSKPEHANAPAGSVPAQRRPRKSDIDTTKFVCTGTIGHDRNKADSTRKAKKRRSADKFGGQSVEERQLRLAEIAANRNDRQNRKRFNRRLQTQNFYKSIHMLESNAKREMNEQPFEDYSIFLYRQNAPEFIDRVKDLEMKLLYPDRERGIGVPGSRGPQDHDFSNRIRSIEDQFKGVAPCEKKPRDLLRAIGKIESTDWNVKEIEKKIQESKMAPAATSQKERVPKWSREQFLARQNKMASKALARQDSSNGKYTVIDSTLKQIDKQLKEPALFALNNKVSSIAGNFTKENIEGDTKENDKKSSVTNTKASSMLSNRSNSELCHFCNKRVYLMERQCNEGLSFHRGCLRCTHCGTALRLGACSFDREGKVYCMQHFGMPGKYVPKKEKSPMKTDEVRLTPDKSKPRLAVVSGLDLLDRGQTPERIEYENLAVLSDQEHSLSPMDEEEWTDRNFGPSNVESENISSEDDASESDSDLESDNGEEEFSEALDTLGDTLQIAQEWTRRYSRSERPPRDPDYGSSSDEFYHEYSSEDDDSDTQTQDENDIRARELRKMEVPKLQPVVKNRYSDTEVASDEETSTGSSCEAQNSATEISTDSEFEHDGVTAVRDPPSTLLDNFFLTNIRGSRFRDYQPTKVHVKSSVIEKPVNGNLKCVKQNCEPKAKPYSNRFLKDYSKESAGVELNIQPIIKTNLKLVKKFETPQEHAIAPLINPRPGDYLLKHTQSTSGIASKKSLELKKQYLLGSDGTTGTIQKSGSASALDTRFKTFHNNISECQKLLNTSAPEKSPTMQTFLQHGSSTLKESGPLSPLCGISSMQGYFHAIPTLSIIEKHNSEISVPETGIYKSPDNMPTPSSAKPDIIDLTISPIGVTNANHVRNLSKPDVIDLTISPDVIDLTISPLSVKKPIQDESAQKQDPYLEIKPDTNEEAEQSDSDFRARSPAHETSIVVPDVTWLSVKQSDGKSVSDDLSSDSLSSSNSSSDEESESNLNRYNELISRSPSPEKSNPNNFVPQIEVTGTSGELMQMDSLMIIDGKYVGDPEDLVNIQSLPDIPNVTNVSILNSKLESASESGNELATVLTETELSDWAVDDAVSDNFVDVEFNIDPEYGNVRKQKKPKACKKSRPKVDLHLHARIAKGEDFDDMVHVCGKGKSAMTNSLQNMDIENIEFMDTGSEDSCIGNVAIASNSVLVNRGYVEFVDNDLTPVVPKRDSFIDNTELPSREIVEVTNRDFRDVDYVEQGACILNNDIKSTIGHVTISQEVNLESLNPDSLTNCVVPVEKDIVHNSSCEQEDDSLFILESADTTTSDALTVVTSPLEALSKCNMDQCLSLSEDKGKSSSTSEKQEQTMRPKSPVKQKDMKHSIEKHSLSNEKLNTTVKQLNPNDQQVYEQYVKKLEEKMAGFGNVRDSIDVRKSRRRSKGNLMKPTGIIESEEKGTQPKSLSLVNDLIHYSSNTDHNMSSLNTSRKLEEISRERVKQKDIIHDMVIDKLTTKKMLNAEKRLNRSRSRSSFSPGSGVVKPNFNKSTGEKLESQLSNNKLTPHSIVIKPQQSTTNNIITNVANSDTNKSKELLKCISPSVDIKKTDRENISPPADIGHGLHYSQSVKIEPDSLVVIENQRSTPLTSFKKLSQRKLLRPLSVHSSFNASPALTSPLTNSHCTNPEALSLPDIHRKLQEELFKTPSAPPQSKQEETKHMVDFLKQNARERVRLKSDEELGLSPEDKLKLLRQKSANKKYAFEANKCGIKSMIVNESFESIGNSNSITAQAPNDTDFQQRPARTKSVNDLAHCSVNYNPEMSNHEAHLITSGSPEQMIKATFTSDPNLLSGSTNKSDKKAKPKDRERRKSIIQAVSDFFLKRKESMSMPTSPTGKYSRFSKFRISPKYKERTKEKDPETLENRCRSESTLTINGHAFEEQAPPIPPPPLNYRPCPVHRLSYSAYDSQSEDLDLQDGTSLEMLNMADSSLALNSFHSGEHSAEPRRGRSKKTGKHAQLKRFQKAQQIQRQLEEIEVKQRQLEANGVCIEKALRGEGGASARHCQSDEQLFASWLSLRKEQKELHIFEEDLRIHAKELQLVDRHEHLQHELKERLAGDDELKTSADLAREGAILQEMLDIVAEHDSLVLQRDRLRNMNLAGSPIYSDDKINTSYMNSLPKLDQ